MAPVNDPAAAASDLFAKPAPSAATGGAPMEDLKSDEQDLAEAAQDELAKLAEAARFASPERVVAVLEAVLFAAEKPLDVQGLQEATQFTVVQLATGLEAVRAKFLPGQGGIVLAELGGRWQLRTNPQVGAYVRRMLQVKPMRLTRAALETLSIIAYRQPVTRPEMEDIRGVDCGAVTKALLERKLIRILGKKDEPGRPLLYGTSKEFLELFNLRDLTQLPTLREFQELSEESRKIVEDEAPNAPAVQGLTELKTDPAVEAKLAAAAQESDAALEQLEKAMALNDEKSKTVTQVLSPPAPANPDGTAATADSSAAPKDAPAKA